MKTCALVLLSSIVVSAEIPYGIEFLAGMRSNYLDDGGVLADDLAELQLQSEISITKSSAVTLAFWNASEMSGEFNEVGILAGLTKEFESFSVSAETIYHSYQNSDADTGMEVVLLTAIPIQEQYELRLGTGYDFGAEALCGKLGVGGSWRVTDESFLEANFDFLAEYVEGEDMLYALSGQLSYTTNITEMVSVTPFVGMTTDLSAGEEVFYSGGVWLEFFF